MNNYIKEKFALTDQGASDVLKASFASFLVYLINMTPVILLMTLMDQLILGNIKNNIVYIAISLSILILMYIILGYEYESLYNATYKESANLRIDISERLSKLPLSYFSKHDLSDLSQTIMSDVAAIEHAMSHSMGKVIGFFIFFPLISILMLRGNIKLGLAIIIPVVGNFLLMIVSKKIQLVNLKKHYETLRDNSESFQETIEMGQDIKSFGISEDIKSKLYKKMETGEKLQLRANISQAIPLLLGTVLMYISISIVILLGSKMLIDGEINILYLVGYLLSIIKIREMVGGITENLAELFYLDDKIARIKEIRNTEIQEGKDVEIKNFDIELKDVTFSYDEDVKVLDNISFLVEQGKVTALVGKSGCGKTSILKIISRLYDYDEGEIIIDNMDIKDISTKSLFDKISIVFQDVTLFNTSVIENIRLGRIDASDEEVKRAAELAKCDDFVKDLPNGYDTLIGENGASLSGGERQRISIARAFLKDAPIVILDEIAASLDVENEKAIQESMNKLMKDKTVVIISHRLKSIENVDQIVVIDDGRVDAKGSHKELLVSSPVYRDLIDKGELADNFRY